MLLEHPKDLFQMELMILSCMDWQIHAVTSASILDTLICLLGYQQNSSVLADSFEQMHSVKESCKLLLAKTLRGMSKTFKSLPCCITH